MTAHTSPRTNFWPSIRWAKVPALFYDGVLIIESTAILEYLLQRHGPSELSVSPSDPEYGTYLQRFHMAESGMANYIAISFGNTFDMDPYKVSGPFDKYCRYQVTKALEMLEPPVCDRQFLLERGFSAADIALGYTLFFAQACTGTVLSDEVHRYYKTLLARPAMQKAMSDLKPPKN